MDLDCNFYIYYYIKNEKMIKKNRKSKKSGI